MIDLEAIHHVGLVVTDLDRSIYFYHDLLGLPFANEPTPWFDGPELSVGVGVPAARLRQVSLLAGDTIMELIEYSNRPPDSTAPPPNNNLGAAHVCFRVADVRATKAELESCGVEFYSEINVVDSGPLAGWRWVYFSDPDGLALELVEVAYYLREERLRNAEVYLRSRPPLAELAPRPT
ncbi:VOC family protein [Jatrophihabitans telluris]|uniref:VOC family protein n=1 Tax=Jatrophihabitans telluris TaxID=2038343 RepID=A0ABY4QU26_9ACTN|nr:VOC family protein [Jatrophihabitans telluris]UQX86995.1 VOC family protein [Jatrophihabitans telluris]